MLATCPSEFGFAPDATGIANARALQRAVDGGGTVCVARPGVYPIAGTVYLGSDTRLRFGRGVRLKKVEEAGPFSHVLLNKGARTRTWDSRISIEGLDLIVNGVDHRTFADVFGLHGQIAFFYVRDLQIRDFRCADLGKAQYCIHICTFEDVLIENVRIEGKKDGVHLGRGRRFVIRDGVFRTYDDAIALNGHDYDVGNPELGWIENGIVQNCHDLSAETTTGFFCRILAGAWREWFDGMEVQKSDTVISEGRLYRVRADPDGRVYVSRTPPTHPRGGQVLDGIRWEHVQDDAVSTAGVRNVVLRDITLEKARTAVSIHFDCDRFSRSYYPGSPLPVQEDVAIENAVVLHGQPTPLVEINTPVDSVSLVGCRLGHNPVVFRDRGSIADDAGLTRVSFSHCRIPDHLDVQSLVKNEQPRKRVQITSTP